MRDDWSTLRKLMFQRLAAGGRLIEDTVTGNPAVFQTNVAKPLTGFTIPFTPVQTGDGDPSPQNPRSISGWQGLTAWRTGENLFDKSNNEEILHGKNFTQNGGIEGSANAVTVCIPCKPNTKYTASKVATKRGAFAYVTTPSIPVNGTPVYGYVSFQGTTATITTGDDATYLIAYLVNTTYETSLTKQDVIDSCQIEVGETASPYAEYTGASYPVTFPALGKNLLPITLDSLKALNTSGQWSGNVYTYNGLTFTVESDMKIAVDGTASASTYFRMVAQDNEITIEPGKYVFHATGSSKFKVTLVKNGGYLTEVGLSNYTPTFTEAFTLRCYSQIASGTVFDNETFAVMAEKGETVSAYEPYTNTVYGGTLDAVTGMLTVEFVEKSAIWGNIKTGTPHVQTGYVHGQITFDVGVVECVSTSDQGVNAFCNVAKIRWELEDKTPQHYYIYGSTYNTAHIYGDFADDTEIVIVAKLATPYEIQLDPITVQTLIGDNTIWTDTNGENTVRYKKKG